MHTRYRTKDRKTWTVHDIPLSHIFFTDAVVPKFRGKRMPLNDRLHHDIKTNGMRHPIVVERCRELGEDRFRVLLGNQRLRIAQEEGWSTVPCMIADNIQEARAMGKDMVEEQW